MSDQVVAALDRRGFLTRVVPACSLAFLCAGRLAPDCAAEPAKPDSGDTHKFDAEFERKTTVLRDVGMQYSRFIEFVKALQSELKEDELVRLLEVYSADIGRRVGQQQAKNSPDTKFKTFVATFRPPKYEKVLTHQIVEDKEKVFELKVTECVWAKVFRDAGLGGRIGHAAVCNMDYYWPAAFNEKFKMERNKTLMQGHDCCNHRYIDTT